MNFSWINAFVQSLPPPSSLVPRILPGNLLFFPMVSPWWKVKITETTLLVWLLLDKKCFFPTFVSLGNSQSLYHWVSFLSFWLLHACIPSWFSCISSLSQHGLYPERLLCPWDSPGKNIGMGCHALLQGNFQTQGTCVSYVSYIDRQRFLLLLCFLTTNTTWEAPSCFLLLLYVLSCSVVLDSVRPLGL